MKLFTSLFVIMLFWGGSASHIGGAQSKSGSADAAKGGQGQEVGGMAQTTVDCNKDLLWSYKLKGRDKSSLTEKFLLCPDVKHNCCNKIDQQKIYHYVNDVMPARHLEYRTKVQQAITKLEKLHKRIKKTIFNFPGNMERKRWCSRQHREIINFQYKPFFEKLQEQIEIGWQENLAQYQTFYCVLCDGSNHQYFETKNTPQTIILDANFCKEFIDNRAEDIKLLNVELIEYMKMVQNVVDCVHYTKSYNLYFFDESRMNFASQTSLCLKNTEGPDFMTNCNLLCQQMSVNEVIPMAEGDFVFLNNAVTLFEKFFSYQERGEFISMKLRLFFKRFEIPKSMTLLSQKKFLQQVEKSVKPQLRKRLVKTTPPPPPAMNPNDKYWTENPGIEDDSPYDMRFTDGKDDENEETNNNGNKNRNNRSKKSGPRKDKRGRVINKGNNQGPRSTPARALSLHGQRLEHEYSMHENYNPELEPLLMNKFNFDIPQSTFEYQESFFNPEAPIAIDDSPMTTSQRVLEEAPVKSVHLGDGRKLQAVSNNQQQQNQGQKDDKNNTGNQKGKPQVQSAAAHFRRKRTAKLVFDKDLYRFYDEITIKKPDNGQMTIFRIKKKPLNVSRFQRVFMMDSGINPLKYQNKRFSLPKAIFYKQLFSHRVPDKRDPNLLFMLADFNKDYRKLARKVLRKDYAINPDHYKFKSSGIAKPKQLEIPEPPLITWASLQSNPGPGINAVPGQSNQQGANRQSGSKTTGQQTGGSEQPK
jgi:hypothetical protein